MANRIVIALACALILASSPVVAAEASGEVTIYRDSWGVPHIYGDSLESAVYGHGWAQAEDRLEELLAAHLIGLGRAAAVFGAGRLDTDYVARAAGHERIARERYDDLGKPTRRMIEAFVAGVQAYMREHPEDVPDWAAPPEPHHVVALYRGFAWAWPWGQARGDLKRAGSHVDDGRGSNQWVVGASRSAEGVPIALIDPHLPWDTPNRLYEAHVHGGDLHFYGHSVVGTPIMAVGHTNVFALSLTTGGPDTADVYEERIHPKDPLRYEYDGEWRPVEVEEISIEVAGAPTAKRTVERTHHGPILRRVGNRAFAARTAYDNEVGLVEQWFEMVLADNLGEFLNALRANQALPQNLMYADVYGNIYYVRAGRVPRRPAGHAWNRPVPGWTSKTEWLGIHALPELVQLLNPPVGFMQNCNVAPSMMMPNSPLTAERYADVLYNSRPRRINQRGRRALELLGATSKLTLDDARRIAVDSYVMDADRWQRALSSAFESHRERFPGLEAAVGLLLTWDGYAEADRRGAALYRFWLERSIGDRSTVPRAKIFGGETLAEDEQLALLEALERTVAWMNDTAGGIDATWGELHRIGRSDQSWPISGCKASGISTLRSVRYTAPDDRGVSRARGGQLCPTVVLLREGGVTSYGATPFGQSDDPQSPHFDDQAEHLFGPGRLRPTWYSRSELSQHVASTRTLEMPSLP